jgi:hypothetical protein
MRLVVVRALPRRPPIPPRTRTASAEARKVLAGHVHVKHLLHQVVQVHAAGTSTRPAAVERGHAMLVVQFALVVVGEDLVGAGHGFESDFGVGAFGFGDFVWMGG